MKNLILVLLLAGCSVGVNLKTPWSHLDVAYSLLGYSEKTHVKELKSFMGINPRRTEWCAAFVNKVLETSGYDSVDTLNIGNPLLAKSYLKYGDMVLESELQKGDILIFRRGSEWWQGHVGFYVGTEIVRGRKYYRVLGGNQDNEVNISLYPEYKLLGIRRISYEVEDKTHPKSSKENKGIWALTDYLEV